MCSPGLFAALKFQDTRRWYLEPSSPLLILTGAYIICMLYWVLAVACVWFRVAARMHDPRRPVRGCVWPVVLRLGGTGLGLVLLVGVGGALGFLLAYLTCTALANTAVGIVTLFVFVTSTALLVRSRIG